MSPSALFCQLGCNFPQHSKLLLRELPASLSVFDTISIDQGFDSLGHEEYPDEPMSTKYLENRRGAGRKSKLSAGDREKLLRMRKEKKPAPEIAHELGVSERYIYKLLREA